jgi:hypothetical protein
VLLCAASVASYEEKWRASAFNAGIPEWRGKVIGFLGGDDWWAQGKTEKNCRSFQRGFSVGNDRSRVHRAGDAMLEIVDAEAAQLRLKLDDGWPWERTIYRVQHADAPAKSKMFRTLSMVPALALPPRWFCGAGNGWGRRVGVRL